MVKKGIVVATDRDMATIEEINDAYCLDCINSGIRNNCLTCKKRSENISDRHVSSNAVDAKIGDIVEYSKNSMVNVIFAFVAIILPIVLTVVSYVVINMISSDDQLSGRIALGVLAISMIGAAVYSYKFSKYRCDYKIISKV